MFIFQAMYCQMKKIIGSWKKMSLSSMCVCQMVLKSTLYQKWGELCNWHCHGRLQSLCGVEAFVKNPDAVFRVREQRDSASVRQLLISWWRLGISPAPGTSLCGNTAWSPCSCKEQKLLEHNRLAVPRTDPGGHALLLTLQGSGAQLRLSESRPLIS